MDTTALTQELHKLIGAMTDETFEFAFTWSPIKGPGGRTYQCSKQDRFRKSELSALHIQVPQDRQAETYDMLSNFFGLDNNESVLGRKMLMVPVIKTTNPAHKNENIEHLISKQHFFYSQMEYSKVYDFAELDRPEPTLKKTARDLVMKLRTLDGSDSKLFWSIDKDTSGAVHIAYPTHIAHHARDLIAQLPSLMRFAFGKEALKLLSAPAARKAIAAPWDPIKMRAVSKEDKKLEAMIVATNTMMNDLEEEDLSGDSDDDSINTKDELDGEDDRETQRYLFQQASSNASVTTLDTRIGTSKPTKDDDPEYHHIEPSPTKKRKETHDDDEEDTNMDDSFAHTSIDSHNDHDSGVDLDGVPNQHEPAPLGLSQGLGELP